MQGHLTVVFKLYFLDIDEVEYIFICLIAIWNFSFVKYRFKFFAHLKIELLFFLLMYVYILSMNHLLDVCTAHMLFHSGLPFHILPGVFGSKEILK